MKEYVLPITDALTRGLRPEPEARGFLTTCTFARPSPYGLVTPHILDDPFRGNETTGQLIHGHTDTLLAKSSSIAAVDETTTPWSTSLLDTDSISAGTIWHFIDMYDAWMMLNGLTVVYKSKSAGIFGESQPVVVSSATDINTGCYFKGRVMLGGFNPDNYWSSAWRGVLQGYFEDFPFAIDTDPLAPGQNFVFWSTIGGGDVFSLFDLDTAMFGLIREDTLHNDKRAMFMELYQRNEVGMAPMPWQGTVQIMKPFTDRVAVYGDDGIALLTPANPGYPTFGVQHVADSGVAGRGSVAGSNDIHLLVGHTGNLWTLDANGVLKKLGYREFISELLNYPIRVTYNSEEGEFYVSGLDTQGSALSYTLTPNGLFESPYSVRSIIHSEDGVYASFSETSDPQVEVVTDTVDFSYRDIKSITNIELGLTYGTLATVDVAVDWRFGPSSDWTTTSWVRVNPEGFAYLRCTAQEFRFRVRCSSYDDFSLSYINVKWQPMGRRTVRGLGVNETNK